MLPSVGKRTGALPAAIANDRNPATPGDVLPTSTGTQSAVHQQAFNEMSPSLNTMTGSGMQPTVLPQDLNQMSPSLKATTSALNSPNAGQAGTGTIKLTGPVQVIPSPLAGQPRQTTH